MNSLCKYCGKLYDTEEELKSHFQEVHEKRKRPCTLCGKQFYNLKHHINISHEKEKVPKKPKEKLKFPCEYCGKIFRSNSMKNHVLKHHSGPRPRNYKCEICGNDYLEERALRVHKMRIHDGIREQHPCPTCGKSYRCASDLSKHIRWAHENHRDHICGTCNKAFKAAFMLRKHIQGVHEGQRNNACEICGKTFFGKYDMKRHIDAVHLKKPDVWKRQNKWTWKKQ